MNETYFSEKQLKRKKLIFKLKIYAGIAALIALLGLSFYTVVYSNVFQIKNIEIIQTDNAEKIDKNKLTDDYEAFLINQSKINLFLGAHNMLSWRDAFAEKFLENYPKLTKFEIQKNYSNRSIKIIIEGRQKMGIWCNAEQDENTSIKIKNCYWFDKTGAIFDNAPYVEGELIYKINDFSGRDLKIGDNVLKKEMFLNLLEIFEVMRQSDVAIKNFIVKNLELQEIETDSLLAPKIYFSLKLSPLFALPAFQNLKKIGIDKIEYVDFRVENRAYYKSR